MRDDAERPVPGCPPARLEVGDVLFQELPGPIATVTGPGWGGAPFAHCALLARAGGRPEVVEAMPPCVRALPLEDFLGRSLDVEGRPAVVVMRVVPALSTVARRAAHEAMLRIGTPYDHAYRHGEDALYCSELVVCAFRAAAGGREVFEEGPMTFVDPCTGATEASWADHFRLLHLPVPEGAVGSNPARLSRAPQLRPVCRLGGWPTPLAAGVSRP